MQITVVYEDEFCLVVSKPNDLLVHHSYYARNIDELSLIQHLKNNGYEQIAPVHRLDRKTSGLILLAKKKEFVSSFQKMFDEGLVSKTYLALLRGFTPESGRIESPVKNDRGNYKEALTTFQTLDSIERDYEIPPYPTQRYSLVAMKPETGRMHQLRIHANKIAHPIINDPKYGNRHHNHYFQEQLGIHFLFLHAWKLAFKHPYSNTDLAFSQPPPEHWNEFIVGLKSQREVVSPP